MDPMGTVGLVREAIEQAAVSYRVLGMAQTLMVHDMLFKKFYEIQHIIFGLG